jgi:hypothetical protein
MPVRDRIAVDAAFTTVHIQRLKEAYPELVEDADLLASTIEGETDFEHVLAAVTDAFLDASGMAEAAYGRADSAKERGDRFKRKADAMKTLAFGMMRAAEQKKVTLPEATISIAKGRTRVVVDDAEALPQGFFRLERVPLKTELADALNDNQAIPGARLEAGEPHLSIRTK